jgi:mRNA interferase MazF
LDPTVGSEIKKSRPALVVSPDEMNSSLRTVIVAPMTGHGFSAPTRIPCRFQGKNGFVVLDQLRAVDRQRIRRVLGKIDSATGHAVLSVLREMFDL